VGADLHVGLARARARRILSKARREGRDALRDREAMDLLAAYGIPMPRTLFAASPDEAIARARRAAEDKAVAAGADRATINVVEVEDLPLAYLPGNSLRTRVRVVGDIAG